KLLINERNKELYITLKSIKAEYRQVLYLVFFEEFDNNEIAKIFRKNKRQIENLLYNAKKALKSELERRGFEYEKL
ncbi:MAG: RNA polymerase subunit sigma-24, partial [Ruminococcus sp.]|nr:RNA polymerase subunit sigma-24 [Ruminococcus sp.]